MSFKRKVFCTAGALLCFTMQMYAQNAAGTRTLTIEQAVEQALAENINIKSGELSLEKSKRSSDYSWNTKLPSLRATAGGSGGLSTGQPGENFSISPSIGLSAGASVSWSFSKTTEFTIETARLNYESQLISFEDTKRSVEKNVRTSFYKILKDQEDIKLKQNALDAAKRQYDSMSAKYNRGALSELDLLNSQLSYQTKELDVITANNTLLSDMTSFKQLLGLEQETEVVLEGSFDGILSAGEITLAGIDAVPSSIKSLEKQLELAELSLKSTEVAAKAPSLSVSLSDSLTPLNFSVSNAKNAMTNPNGDFKSDFSYLKNNLSASISASIPLDAYIKGSSSSVNIENQKNTIEGIKLQIDSSKEALEISKKTALVTIAQIQKQIEQLNKQIELAQKTYDLTLQAYNHGLKDFNTLQTASDNIVTYKGQLMTYAVNLENAIIELENTLGVPFGTLGVK